MNTKPKYHNNTSMPRIGGEGNIPVACYGGNLDGGGEKGINLLS